MKLVRRCPVTLLEILIVIAILAMAAGIVSIGVSRSLVDQRFRNEVGMIVEELRLAQDLMLVLGTDVKVKFAEDPGHDKINFWMELETKVSDSLQQEILKKHHQLKTIRGFTFRDENATEVVEGATEVRFFSKGAVMSRGIIHMATSSESRESNVLEAYIPLAGYPGPILSVDEEKKAEAIYSAYEDVNFDRSITQDTFSKLPESLKPKEEEKKEEEQAKKGDGKKSPPEQPKQPPAEKP